MDTPIVDILNDAARVCAVREPGDWVAGGRDEHEELRQFLREAGEEVIDRYDFEQAPGARSVHENVAPGQVHMPDGGRTPLRVQNRDDAVFNLSQKVPCIPLTGTQAQGQIEALNGGQDGRTYYWTNGDGGVELWGRGVEGEGAAGDSVAILWMTREWMSGRTDADAEIRPKSMFTHIDDATPFPRRAMVLGVQWRFRQRNGMDWTQMRADFDMQIGRWADTRSQRRRFDMTGGRGPGGYRFNRDGAYWVNPPGGAPNG